MDKMKQNSGTDPGFLKRGFIFTKIGVRFFCNFALALFPFQKELRQNYKKKKPKKTNPNFVKIIIMFDYDSIRFGCCCCCCCC